MSNETYKVFTDTFTRCQNAFGLDHYSVFFQQGKLKDCFARICMDTETPTATVMYAEKLSPAAAPEEDPIRSARHESIHLLLHKLETLASDRYTTEQQIDEEVEGLTIKLEKLIKDV